MSRPLLDDAGLRGHLARRADGARIDEPALRAAIASRVATETQRNRWLARRAGWRPALGLAAGVLVVLVVVVAAVFVRSGPIPPVGETPEPSIATDSAPVHAVTAEELNRLVDAAARDASLAGSTVITNAQFTILLGCLPEAACPYASIGGVFAFAEPRVRNASYSTGAGGSAAPLAVRLRKDDAVDLLGPVRPSAEGGLVWKLTDLSAALEKRPLTNRLEPDVYLVDTPLNRSDVGFRCLATGAADPYGCGGDISWLGTTPLTETPAGISGPADGLRVQNGAYGLFAPGPTTPSTPRRAFYLVRPPVNAPDTCFMCPPAGAVELLARLDPIAVPEPTPAPSVQPTSGDGWRLLGDGKVGEPYSVGLAQDRGSFAAMWGSLGLAGPPPSVEFGTEVVVAFGAAVSGSCPEIRFDGVGVDAEAGIVYGRFLDESELRSPAPGETPRACTADASPHTFVVAVSRDLLPPSPFTLRLGRTRGCGSCPHQEIEVTLDIGGEVDPSDAELAAAVPDSAIAGEAKIMTMIGAARAYLAGHTPFGPRQTHLVASEVRLLGPDQARVTFHDYDTGATLAVVGAIVDDVWRPSSGGTVDEPAGLSTWELERAERAIRSDPGLAAGVPLILTYEPLDGGSCRMSAGFCLRALITGGDSIGKDVALEVTVDLLTAKVVGYASPADATTGSPTEVPSTVVVDDPAWAGQPVRGGRADVCRGVSVCGSIQALYPGVVIPANPPATAAESMTLRLVRGTVETVTWDGITLTVRVRDRAAGFQQVAIRPPVVASFRWLVVTEAGETLLSGSLIID